MIQIRIDVHGKAVQRHPAADAHPDRANLGFAGRRIDPDANPPVDGTGGDPEAGEGGDHPFFQPVDKAAHVAAAAIEVELDIADALPRPVIRIAPAASGPVHRKAGDEQLGRVGTGARGIERRMFDQPDAFGGGTRPDGLGAAFHVGDRRFIVCKARSDFPLNAVDHAPRFIHASGYKHACMQGKVSPIDAGRAWTEAMALLSGQREILLTVAGFFIMLPALLLNMLRPFSPAGPRENWTQELLAWTNANFTWVVLVAALAGLGRLAILILLFSPGRPTVGEALAAGGRLLILFLVMDLLIGFMLLGGAFLFVLPALYIFGRTFLAEAAFVANRAHGPIAGIVAGFEASRGNGWRIFLVAGIIYVAGLILSAALGSVLGVLGALLGGAALSQFLSAFVEAGCGAGVSLILVLMSVAIWRQSAEKGDVRSGVLR